jgi:hypothetical protein
MDNKIKEYIEKQKLPQKEIVKKVRNIILKTFPGIKEELKWGVPVYGNGKYYIGALKDHVNLGFSINGLSKREIANFEGQGTTMRHIKIHKAEDINDKNIIHLLKIVRKRCKSC